jgi:hypothetical protein
LGLVLCGRFLFPVECELLRMYDLLVSMDDGVNEEAAVAAVGCTELS